MMTAKVDLMMKTINFMTKAEINSLELLDKENWISLVMRKDVKLSC